VAGNLVLFAGGAPSGDLWPTRVLDSVDVFTVGATRAQDSLRVAANALPTTRAGLSGASNGTHAHFVGGMSDVTTFSYAYTSEATVYDAAAVREANPSMSLSQSRGFMGVAVAKNVLLFAGGNNANTFFDTVDAFIMPSRARRSLKLSRGRREPSAGAVGNHAVFAGGTINCGTFTLKFCTTDEVDVLDVDTLTFAPALKLRTPRYRMGVTTLGNRIIFAGGESSDGNEDHFGTLYSDITIFDRTAPTSLTESTSRLSHARSRIAAATVNGVALFVGGFDNSAAATTVVDVFDGTAWRTMGPLPTGMTHARVGVVGGVAVFAGGSSFDRKQPSDTIVVYTASTPATAATRAPTAPPTPAPTNQPCSAYSSVCGNCVNPAVHTSDCRFCGSVCQTASVPCSDTVNVPMRGQCPIEATTTLFVDTTSLDGPPVSVPPEDTTGGETTGGDTEEPVSEEPEIIWTLGAYIGIAVGAGVYVCTAVILCCCMLISRGRRKAEALRPEVAGSSEIAMKPTASATPAALEARASQTYLNQPIADGRSFSSQSDEYRAMPAIKQAPSVQSGLYQQPYSSDAQNASYLGASGSQSYGGVGVDHDVDRPNY
jgi:hypothetical protein